MQVFVDLMPILKSCLDDSWSGIPMWDFLVQWRFAGIPDGSGVKIRYGYKCSVFFDKHSLGLKVYKALFSS